MLKEKLNIPVVLIHRGNHDYVQTCINQAKFYNKDVIVISDIEYKNCDNVDIKNILITLTNLQNFTSHYLH